MCLICECVWPICKVSEPSCYVSAEWTRHRAVFNVFWQSSSAFIVASVNPVLGHFSPVHHICSLNTGSETWLRGVRLTTKWSVTCSQPMLFPLRARRKTIRPVRLLLEYVLYTELVVQNDTVYRLMTNLLSRGFLWTSAAHKLCKVDIRVMLMMMMMRSWMSSCCYT